LRAAGVILPAVNWGGASAEEVVQATSIVERADSVDDLFDLAARSPTSMVRGYSTRNVPLQGDAAGFTLAKYDAPIRLALEMAAHEQSERTALEGELALLRNAWKEAEEIAAIADDLLPPPGADDFIRRHRRG
jgi:hypothetical protein